MSQTEGLGYIPPCYREEEPDRLSLLSCVELRRWLQGPDWKNPLIDGLGTGGHDAS